MKKQLALATAALSVAALVGCNTQDSASSETLTLEGSAQNAALEAVEVTDATDSVVAVDATDENGDYTVVLDSAADLEFPLKIRVIHEGDTLVKVIPEPGKRHGHMRHDLDSTNLHRGPQGDSLRAHLDSLPVCAAEVMASLKATVDSVIAAAKAGETDIEDLHDILKELRPTDCRPAKKEAVESNKANEPKKALESDREDSTTTDETPAPTEDPESEVVVEE